MKRLAAFILCTATLISVAGCAQANPGTASQSSSTAAASPNSNTSGSAVVQTINISHQPYSHGLPSYIADKEDLFKQAGLNAKILWFTSGPAQNEALGANEWDVGAMGSPPSIAGGIAYNSKIIAFSVDDTVSCDYWVRKDSDIAKIKDQVPGAPGILGNAATWKGKKILCPIGTSAHYMLIATLNKLGLKESDVNIVQMDVPQAYTAFKAGQGDIVALWDPQSFYAAQEGWVKVSDGKSTGETMPTVIVASDKAIKEKPEAIMNWLKVYFQVCDKYRDNTQKQADYLLTMQLDNGIKTDAATAKKFVDKRPLPSIKEEQEWFSGTAGSRKADTVMYKIVDFFVKEGKYTEKDKEKLKSSNWIDSQFIDRLAAQQK